MYSNVKCILVFSKTLMDREYFTDLLPVILIVIVILYIEIDYLCTSVDTKIKR